MAVKARDGGDEETADQLVLWASELFKEASHPEGSPTPEADEQPLPDVAGKNSDLFH
jgi:hypothetical protein